MMQVLLLNPTKKLLRIGMTVILLVSSLATNAYGQPAVLDSTKYSFIKRDTIVNTYTNRKKTIQKWLIDSVNAVAGNCHWFGRGLRGLVEKDKNLKIVKFVFESRQYYYVVYLHKGYASHSHLLVFQRLSQKLIMDVICPSSTIESFADVTRLLAVSYPSNE